MSEDLRYYFFDHEADEQPPISPDEGWKSMQQILDKEMPVSSKRRRRFLFFFIASLAGIMLLATSIPLKNYFVITSTNTTKKEKVVVNTQKEKDALQGEDLQKNNNTSSLTANNISETRVVAPGNEKITSNNNNPALFSKKTEQQLLVSDAATQNKVDQDKSAQSNKQSIVIENKQPVSSSNKDDSKEQKTEVTVNNSNKKKSTNNFKPGWQLNAGIGINVSFENSLRSLRPYPFAELNYNFSKRFFASASLGLFSPVGTKASGVEKTVYVNDTSYNVSRYNKMLNYKRLDYIDVALSGGIKINNKLSLQAGMQVSRLLHSSKGKSLEPYDFNSNIIQTQIIDVTTLPVTPSAAPIYTNTVNVQKYDIRYLAGINYDLKKISLGIQYQAALNPVLKGTDVSGNKNKMITLKAAYRFK